MEAEEMGTMRRHTFFCINKTRHTGSSNILEIKAKEVRIFDEIISGWLITTEEPVIEKIISLNESIHGEVMEHDPE
jgi:hypothetical protein